MYDGTERKLLNSLEIGYCSVILDAFEGKIMDVTILYRMVKATAESASKALDPCIGSSHNFYDYGGYPVYIERYNMYQHLTVELFGGEAQALFPQLLPGSWKDPSEENGRMWRTHLENVAVRLGDLEAYLRSKLGDTDRRVQSVVDLVEAHLRPSIFKVPDKEREIQDILETIFHVRDLPYLREKVHITYSSKTYVPDFTFDSLNLAVEVKLCNRESRKKELIDEINADIIAYQTKYESLIFIIYDLGFIRDVAQFSADIEKNPNVYSIVIKK